MRLAGVSASVFPLGLNYQQYDSNRFPLRLTYGICIMSLKSDLSMTGIRDWCDERSVKWYHTILWYNCTLESDICDILVAVLMTKW